ncbi:MAG: hypothetical protein IT209_02975 [Armatimonadetes bacterium]|nr:hypothetical protein [Armatimonadota bacterium]
MKRAFITVAILAATCFAGLSSVHAGTYTFQPNPVDLYDLDHYYNYLWGVGWQTPAGETITNATLTIKNINNWTLERDNNWLYMHLIDNAPTGVKSSWDNESNGDEFAHAGPLIDVYTDNDTKAHTLTYDFSQLGLVPYLQSYAADGKWGIGFDPDCHYFNDGIKLVVCTTTSTTPPPPVPEPMTMVMSFMGLSSLGAIRRLRRG